MNTLAATYVEQNFKTKFESTMQASDWLSKQLVDLQMKVETSQEKLVRYQKEHEILGTDEKQNIITEKLDELNKEMTMAESDRMQKEAVYRQTQSERSGRDRGRDHCRYGGWRKRPRLRPSGQVARTAGQSQNPGCRTQHPVRPCRIRKSRSSTTSSKRSTVSCNRKRTRPSTTSRVSTWRLCSGKTMLRGSFEKQKQEANKLNESAIEYSILKRDLDSNRTLYEGCWKN